MDNGNLGAQIDAFGRHLKFVDGTFSTGGMFIGKDADVSYTELYDTHDLFMNLKFGSDGNSSKKNHARFSL